MDTFDEDNLHEVDDPDQVLQDDSSASKFEEKGVVIQDPETGKMYVVEY